MSKTESQMTELIDGLPWDSSKRFPREPMEVFMAVFRSVVSLAFFGVAGGWFAIFIRFDDWFAFSAGVFWTAFSAAWAVVAFLCWERGE